MSGVPDFFTHMGGVPVGIPEVGPRTHIVSQHVVYFVDGNNGSANNGGTSWTDACITIQAAVTLANSPRHATDNVDVLIANGQYNEEVKITRTGTGLTDAAMLWKSGGTSVGLIGTLRLIGVGSGTFGGPIASGVFLYNDDDATYPALSVGRPNVEIHNINFRTEHDSGIANGSWYDSEGILDSSRHVEMPVVSFVDNYNYNHDGAGGGTLLGGAANNCLMRNCRINGNGYCGCVANSGGNWIWFDNCIFEYGDDYALAMVGSAKGTNAENVVSNCLFQANSDCDIYHATGYMNWVKSCWFAGASTTKNLNGYSVGTSGYSWIIDCHVYDEANLVAANNGGWSATGIQSASETSPLGATDLATATWSVIVSD